ncbi:Flp family type IVb pilin [Blastomonas sp. SL216]|jgi:pilus assembly protein Flp/PilA|uniref:Flp family type IVb pilin n=1 Tax=Blastomonas sp. SL216 TaxID=2995169 RepID=UPI002376F4D8|nr:Flp family type IVb pilin [Blastomonas sp. SL216]
MLQTFVKIVKSKAGATAIEYGLIAALIAVAAMVAIQGVASESTKMWNKVGSEVNNN